MAQVKRLERLRPKDFACLLTVVPGLVKFPVKKLMLDYDEEADVLYVSFRRPQQATDSDIRDDDIIVHRRGKEVVGLTILDASTR
jgi:uncharacterized protein YuzE